MANGKSVQLYLVDGTAGGLMVAEIVNWTGKILSCPRSNLDSFLRRDEVVGTGVYVLLGDDPNNFAKPFAYIGETDEVKRRIKQHNTQDNDWWNRVIAITNKDLNMTKAHVRYLEHRMIIKARDANRSTMKNGNEAVPSSLPEAAKSDMEQFLEQVELIIQILGVNILRTSPIAIPQSVERSLDGEAVIQSPEFEIRKSNLIASAQEVDGEFVVFEGSEAMVEWRLSNSVSPPFRNRLIEDGTLKLSDDGLKLTFSRNHAFSTPSGAAAVVLGMSANGRIEWRVKGTGQRYKDWKESSIAVATEN